jgi:hypothetical protein
MPKKEEKHSFSFVLTFFPFKVLNGKHRTNHDLCIDPIHCSHSDNNLVVCPTIVGGWAQEIQTSGPQG